MFLLCKCQCPMSCVANVTTNRQYSFHSFLLKKEISLFFFQHGARRVYRDAFRPRLAVVLPKPAQSQPMAVEPSAVATPPPRRFNTVRADRAPSAMRLSTIPSNKPRPVNFTFPPLLFLNISAFGYGIAK